MQTPKRTCIVIPTYNEADNIGALIDDIYKNIDDVSILVVDDDSPDGTAAVVREKMERYPGVSLLVRKGERGFASAYRAGYKKVFDEGTYDFIITMDADFSHNPRYLKDLLSAMDDGQGTRDLVIGSRYVSGGGVLHWGLYRRLLSTFGNLYARLVLRLPIKDITAGFLCIRISFLKMLPWQDLRAEGYAWQMELKQLLYLSGAKIHEMPIIFEERRVGVSKISRRIIFEGLLFPLKLRLRDSEVGILWKLFALAITVRGLVFLALLFALGQQIFVLGDTSGYAGIAHNVLSGNGFSFTIAGQPALQDFRPPLYPLLLAGSFLLSGSFIPLIILQIVLASCIPPLTYLLGREFMVSKKALLIAAGIAIFEPLLVIFSTYLLTDILFLFFSLIAILMAVRFFKRGTLGDAILMGGALGLATLIRAVGEYLIIYILAFFLWKLWEARGIRKRFLVHMSLGVLVFCAILAPWIVRNYQTFGTLSVSSEGPWVLYFDYLPSLYTLDRGLSFPDARTLAKQELQVEHPEINFTNRISPRLLFVESERRIWEEKKEIPKLQLINTIWFFTQDNYNYHLNRFNLAPDRPPLFSPTELVAKEGLKSVVPIFQYLRSQYFIPVLGRLLWVFVTLFALCGFVWQFLRNKNMRFYTLFVGGIILYYYIVSSPIGLAGEGRIRIPASPILFLFASVAIVQFWAIVKKRFSH